jgi:N-acetylmuramoyl-L-alanine amidase
VIAECIPAASPNFNARKKPIRFVVLHYTGMIDGPAALERMCDPAAQVSAHYMVETDGRIFRLVDEGQRAWHAGVSSWAGETDMNSASIGIEIVNGGHDFGLPDFPPEQMSKVIALVSDVIARHGIGPEGVIGHSDIAPERKQDPGERFDWDSLSRAGAALNIAETDQRAEGDLTALLAEIGYDPAADPAAVISAFQRRFRQARIDAVIDDETEDLIRRVAAHKG